MLRIHGHRGCRAVYPENSIEGVQAAFACGAFAVEIDVHLTSDDDFIVVHDGVLHPGYYVLNSSLTVAESSLQNLTAVGFGQQRLEQFPEQQELSTSVPSLQELIALFPEQENRFIIEVKIEDPSRASSIAKHFANWLKTHAYNPFRVQSFSLAFLESFHELMNTVPCHLLIEDKKKLTQLWPSWMSGVGLHKDLIDEAIVSRAQESGLELAAWTVNSLEEARHLMELGVNELITDAPQLLTHLVK